jgi:hypothetical protein
MNRICKVTCLALLMNALHGFSQEGVRYRTVQAGGLNICDRELSCTNECPHHARKYTFSTRTEKT